MIEKYRLNAFRKAEERRKAIENKQREEAYRRSMYRRGNDFEDYVRGMFPEDRFKLVHRSPTHEETNGRYVHDMIYPDLRFVEKSTGRRFWVEVKYRSRAEPDGSIVWCADNQLRNYKRTMRLSGEKVLIILGVGGTVQNPWKVYCLDLARINYTTLFYRTYKDHRIMYRNVQSLEQLEYIASEHRYC